jgi:hypothetical protein
MIQLSLDPGHFTSLVFAALLASAIGTVNALLTLCIKLFTSFEYFESHSEYHAAVSWRVAVGLSFNATVGITLANVLIYERGWNFSGSVITDDKLVTGMWLDNGLAVDIWVIMLANVFTHPLVYIFLPMHIWEHFMIWYIKKHPGKFMQKQAHMYFEAIQPDMHEWFADAHRTVCLGLFFFPVMPLSVLISVIGITLQYITDKYLLLRRYAFPWMKGENVAISMTHFFDNAILMFTIGQVSWDWILRGEISLASQV